MYQNCCKKCGGTWRFGTYSDYLTVKEWNGE